MNIATTERRYEVSRLLSCVYREERHSLCWEDYKELVWPMAESLCQKAIDDKLFWTQSKDCKLFNMTLTSAYDSYSYKQFW